MAGHGGEHVGHRLHRLHIAEGLPGGDRVPLLGQVDKDDIPQGVLGEVGEADGADAVLLLEPLVGFGVAQFLGNVHGDNLLYNLRLFL